MLIYTALGDSITFGQSASSTAKAYPQLVVSALGARAVKARSYVLAQPGWTSAELADALTWWDPHIIHRSKVITVWIGGVDLLLASLASIGNPRTLDSRKLMANYHRNMRAILCEIKRVSSARIICCTQYNPFPNSSIAVHWINQLNLAIEGIAKLYRAGVAPVHAWFKGKQADLIHGYRKGEIEDALKGSPPIHPNNRGHLIIAKGLLPYLLSAN